jgi:hypothetical protein
LRAERSNPSHHVKEEWIASSASLLAMTVDGYDFAISRREAPEVLQENLTLREQGRRESRVHAVPAVSRAIDAKNTHTSIQVQRRHSDFPCAMALRLTSCSPRRTGFVVTVASGSFRKLDASVAASGPHDFTVRNDSVRLSPPSRPPLPAPTSATMANAPLTGRDAEVLGLIWGNRKADYFRSPGWTKPMRDLPVGQHKRLGGGGP